MTNGKTRLHELASRRIEGAAVITHGVIGTAEASKAARQSSGDGAPRSKEDYDGDAREPCDAGDEGDADFS